MSTASTCNRFLLAILLPLFFYNGPAVATGQTSVPNAGGKEFSPQKSSLRNGETFESPRSGSGNLPPGSTAEESMMTTLPPCLSVGDLSFGALLPGQTGMLALQVCNNGDDPIQFKDMSSQGGGAFLTWMGEEFSVAQADIDRMKSTPLNSGECLTINVGFSANSPGVFRTTAHFWSNTDPSCGGRDSSVWTARVVTPGPRITNYDWKERWVTADAPCTKNNSAGYDQDIEVGNDGTAPFTVEGVAIANDPGGVFTIANPGNVTQGKRIDPGVTEKVRVAFRPVEQKAYSAVIRLYFRSGSGAVDSVSGFLDGNGTESCIGVDDLVLVADRDQRSPVTDDISLRSSGTRPVTITSLGFSGTGAPAFSFAGPSPVLPLTINPGESLPVSITFTPPPNGDSPVEAVLNVEGNFAYVDCAGSCSDSSAVLTGVLGTLSVEEGESAAGYAVRSISPNPFGGRVEIAFALGKSGPATVQIHDARGRMVRELLHGELEAGEHRVEWDGVNSAAGIYYVRIHSGEWNASRRVVLVR